VTTRVGLAATAVLLALVTTACMTGERPTLGEPVAIGGPAGTPTGNVAVDTVLQHLERTDHPSFTADYDITRKLGPNSTDGVVVQDEDDTSITVGDVRFLQGTESSTCNLSEQTCEEGTLDARISDYSVGSGFYADAPARALRIAFERRNGEPTASQAAIGGITAACVLVPVGTGAETYCATPLGPVARWDTAALNVELTALQDVPDESAFAPPG
jgi:hypothetical protein